MSKAHRILAHHRMEGQGVRAPGRARRVLFVNCFRRAQHKMRAPPRCRTTVGARRSFRGECALVAETEKTSRTGAGERAAARARRSADY